MSGVVTVLPKIQGAQADEDPCARPNFTDSGVPKNPVRVNR